MTGKKILIWAGPSGGHLFPALAFAEKMRLSCPEAEFYLATGRKGKRFASRFRAGLFREIIYLSDFPSAKLPSRNGLGFLLKLPGAFWEASRLVRRIGPDLSTGFGSYISFPGILCSRWLKVPTLIHEQNLLPGKATRWLMPRVDCAALSFPEMPGRPAAKRLETTGLPLRRDLVRAALEQKPGEIPAVFQEGRFKIAVVGGSQGARSLNSLVLETFSYLTSEEKREIAVIHITGTEDAGRAAAFYREQGIESEIYPFFEKMEALYGSADLAVTRAGANTLFELALFGLPAVVVPYPHAGEHQLANARYFEARGAVLCGREKETTGYHLYRALRNLKNDPEKRRAMKQALSALQTADAPERLAGIALSLMKGSQK